MTRLLVVLARLILVWVGARRLFLAVLRSPEGRQLAALWRLFGGVGQAARGPAGAPGARREARSHPLHLVRCAHCNTHVPADRAVRSPRGTAYCSQECMDGAQSS